MFYKILNMPLDFINWLLRSEACSEFFQTSKTERFEESALLSADNYFHKTLHLRWMTGFLCNFCCCLLKCIQVISINVEEKKRIRNILEVIFSKGKHFDLNIIIQKTYGSVTMWLCNMSLQSMVFLVISWVFSMLIFLFSYLNLFIYPQPHRTYATLLVIWKLHLLRRRFTSWQDDKKLIKHSNFLQSVLINSWFTDPNSGIYKQ